MIANREKSVEQRITALEQLHELVEQIDYAICTEAFLIFSIEVFLAMENLNLWPTVFECIVEKNKDIRMYGFWVMATAAQHNPKTQDALIKHGALAKAIEALCSDIEAEVRQKSALVISAIVKQSHVGFMEFTRLDGFAVLAQILAESDDHGTHKRLAFFLGQLLHERPRLGAQYKVLFDRVNEINAA